MLQGFRFHTLGLTGTEKKEVDDYITQNGGTLERMTAKSIDNQIMICSTMRGDTGYSLVRAYRLGVPVVDFEYLKAFRNNENQQFTYENVAFHSKQLEEKDTFRTKKRKDHEENLFQPPSKGSRPLKDKKPVDYYSKHTPLDIDIETEKEFCSTLSDFQEDVKYLNENFERWDLDDTQKLFFSQYLVELDNVSAHFIIHLNVVKNVFEFEQTEETLKQFATLERKFEKEKAQQTPVGSFLEYFTQEDNNQSSPFSIFFKMNDHIHECFCESTIHSFLYNLFLQAVSYEKNIIFGTQYSLSESLTKRADWLKEHTKLEDKQDLYPDIFLSFKNLFGDQSYDSFILCEVQRYEFENEDVFLHKDVCKLVLYMRCLFKDWINRLLSADSLTCDNMDKIKVFGGLVAGSTIAWLEMKLKFRRDVDPVKGQAIPPFTYALKISDIHDLTTVKGLSNTLMILQYTFNQVKTLEFEKCCCVLNSPSKSVYNTTGKTIDTSKVYKKFIAECLMVNKSSLNNIIVGKLKGKDTENIFEIANFAPDDVSKQLEEFSSFLKDNKFEIEEELASFDVSMLIIDEEEFCTALLVTLDTLPRITLFYQNNKISPIILICKHNATLKFFKLRPTNESGWQKAITKIRDLQDKDDRISGNSYVDGDEENKDNKEQAPSLNPYNPYLENSLVHPLKKKFDEYAKGNWNSVPSLFSIIGCKEETPKYSIYREPYSFATLVIVFTTKSLSKYPNGVFIKLTHTSCEDPQIMEYFRDVPQNIKTDCNHIAQVVDFNKIYLKDNNDIFFACLALLRKHYEKKVRDKLDLDNFNSRFSREFFTFKNPIEIAYMEMLQPINIREMIRNLKMLQITTSRVKVIILVRWIGQCLTILSQLHTKLNILHCDISFDNILTRRSIIGPEKMGQLILKECNNDIGIAETIVSDLVISDLNTAVKLQPLQNNSSDETRRSIDPPEATKFPYTWFTYEYYSSIQADNYAMAIFIAKLARRLLFEDFGDFMPCKKLDDCTHRTFKDYGNHVISYFEKKLSDKYIEPNLKLLLPGLTDLLKYIIYQDKSNPSVASNCLEIYNSKINCVLDNFETDIQK